MRRLIPFLIFASAAVAQYPTVPSSSYPALDAVLNGRLNYTVASSAPALCDAGKQVWLNSGVSPATWNLCDATNHWAEVAISTQAYVNPSFIASLAATKLTFTALGDLVYGGAGGAGTRLAGNTSATKLFLYQTGTGSVSAAPIWGPILAADVPGLAAAYIDWNAGSGGASILNKPVLYYQTLKYNGVATTQRSVYNIIGGTNVTISCADNGGANSTDCTFNATAGAGGYATFKGNGTPVTARTAANFSSEFTVADNSGAGQTDVGVSAVAASKVTGATAYTTVPFGSPTCAVAVGTIAQTCFLTLTGNLGSSTLDMSAVGTGRPTVTWRICQDATGGRTFVAPTNVIGMGTIASALNSCSSQRGTWDGTNLQMEALMYVTGVPGGGLTLPGATSGYVDLQPVAVAGGVITIPNVTATMVTTGDTGSVVTAMLAALAVTGPKIANNAVASAQMAAVNTRRTACLTFGGNDASALTDANLGPQSRQFFINAPGTAVEMEVSSDGGTPSIILGRNRAGTIVNLTSAALAATGVSSTIACSSAAGGAGIDGTTTCASTLQNTSLNAGDWITAVSGTAGGTAKQMSACLTWTVN